MEPQQLPGQRIHHEPVSRQGWQGHKIQGTLRHIVPGQPMLLVPTLKQPDISGQGVASQQMTKAVVSRQAEVTAQFAVPGSVSFSSMPSGSQSQPVVTSNHQTSLPTQQTTLLTHQNTPSVHQTTFPTTQTTLPTNQTAHHTILPTHHTSLPTHQTALPKPILSSAANMEPTNLHLLSSLSLSLTTP